LSDTVARDKIAALLGSGQVGKAMDFGSMIRRFESFLPSQKSAADRISIGGGVISVAVISDAKFFVRLALA
jgi:hypothetical protein